MNIFIEASYILSGYIVDIFNKILGTGVFPESWTRGLIIPIHKKGSKLEAKNYRGITLLNNLSKLFTSVLNNRILQWCDYYDKISDSQFGFRKGRSTIDAVFILNSLINSYLNINKRLYCTFVDLKQCFDTIYRNGLWFKLHKSGINGKLLRIVRNMYQSVKSCVKLCNNHSDFFELSLGLRQGEIMSPILFSMFVDDLELFLQKNHDSGRSINDICLILLLFADDMVILGLTPSDLQTSLNQLYEYCKTWGLEVNVDKTKIVVFRQRGLIKRDEKWFYNDNEIEVVN